MLRQPRALKCYKNLCFRNLKRSSAGVVTAASAGLLSAAAARFLACCFCLLPTVMPAAAVAAAAAGLPQPPGGCLLTLGFINPAGPPPAPTPCQARKKKNRIQNFNEKLTSRILPRATSEGFLLCGSSAGVVTAAHAGPGI